MKTVLLVLLISIMGHVNAAIFDVDNAGSFDYGGFTWDTDFTDSNPIVVNDNNGFITTGADALAGFDVQIIGSDTGSGFGAFTSMVTSSSVSGTISVAWDYFSLDDFAGFDPFVWLLDGAPTSITDGTFDPATGAGTGDQAQSGIWTSHVDANTLFGFSIASVDNLLGGGLFSADVGLLDLSFTADVIGDRPGGSVPIPTTPLLIGAGIAAFGFVRKVKAAA